MLKLVSSALCQGNKGIFTVYMEASEKSAYNKKWVIQWVIQGSDDVEFSKRTLLNK